MPEQRLNLAPRGATAKAHDFIGGVGIARIASGLVGKPYCSARDFHAAGSRKKIIALASNKWGLSPFIPSCRGCQIFSE